MKADIRQQLHTIFLAQTGLKACELYPDSRLEQDCGVTGDDAWELIEAIHNQFGTDFSELALDQYFRQEGEGLFSSLFNRFRAKHRKAFPVTIGHLFTVVEAGKWIKPPQVRKI